MIEITTRYDVEGNPEQVSYCWVGNGKITEVAERVIEHDPDVGWVNENELQVGPYRLRVIDYEIQARVYSCVRKDWPFWWVLVLWHRVNRIPDLVYRRFIVTLAVWKLADYDPAAVPHLGDVHLVQWIRRLFNNVATELEAIGRDWRNG